MPKPKKVFVPEPKPKRKLLNIWMDIDDIDSLVSMAPEGSKPQDVIRQMVKHILNS